MNNPVNTYDPSNQQNNTNDLHQLSSSQSNYINQFVGNTPQSSYPQSITPGVSPQQNNQLMQTPPVNMSTVVSDDTNVQRQSNNTVNQQLYGNPQNLSLNSNQNSQFQSPIQNSQPTIDPVQPISPNINNSAISRTSPYQSVPQQFPQDNVYTNMAPQNDSQQVGNQQYIPTNQQLTQGSQVPLNDNGALNAPTLPQSTHSQAQMVQDTPNDLNIEPQVMSAQQVNVNQDYADNSSVLWNNTPLRPAVQQQSQFYQPQYNQILQNPPTQLTVDNDFADGSSFGDDSSVTTGFLPAFDDTNDDSMLPMVSDDDDFIGDADDDDDAPIPMGFSDFDPNEQVSSSMDSLSGFETQSLEEEANRIDVDFSESMPSNTQSVGVLVQDPQNQMIEPQSQMNVNNSIPNTINYSVPAPQSVNQVEPQIQQTVAPSDSELSPTARLNQLLEEEDNAEKVIMQKQKQSVMKVANSPKMVEPKANIFKQVESDVAFQGDLRNQLSVKKPTSKYFMIISLVIIISVIGFLLVLLGLSLL